LKGDSHRSRSPYLQAVALDNSIPIDPVAAELWLRDVDNPLRWFIRPVLQFSFAIVLHVTWALKRLPLPQFRAHGLLQRMICWFCRNAVSPEANVLILRHFATESNILNFLRDNSASGDVNAVAALQLYPQISRRPDPRRETARREAELGQIADAPRVQNPVQVIHFVLHDPGMKIAHRAVDGIPGGVLAGIAQIPVAGHQAAHAGHRQAALPALLRCVSPRGVSWG
jgi:hypothetical protein